MQTTKNRKNKKRLWWAVFLFLAVGFLVGSGALGAESSFGDLSISNQLRNLMSRPEINMGSERPAVTTVIGQILYGFLGFLGVISLLLTIYAGIKWMLAEGNEETISESKKIILYAMVGLAIIMGAYAMTSFVIGKMWESLTPTIEIQTPPVNPVELETPVPVEEI
ncbi:hypothetical protein GYA13_04340 [Candidatus Kuenenbacteria bacterium]|nr:hypothetical protein [Candidatus Kuenenbacteria bacterium]